MTGRMEVDDIRIPEKIIAPVYEADGVTLYQGNCGEILPQIKGVDLVVTDPPWQLHGYTASIIKTGKVSQEAETRWFKELWAWYASWLTIVHETGVRKGWFFVGWHQLAPFIRIMTLIGWPIQEIFTKPDREFLVYAGPDIIDPLRRGDIDDKFYDVEYSNHKSTKFLKKIIVGAELGQEARILDPFSGEGSTLIAGIMEGYEVIGIEYRKECCDKTIEKLRGLTTQ